MGAAADLVRYPVRQRESPRPAADSNHIFANNVRFVSMVAIIAQHSLTAYPLLQHGEATPLTLLLLVQFFKFGTIAFFLVAGFLFGERIDQYSSAQYYGRRLKNVLLPWCVWYLSYCVLRVGTDFARHRVPLHSAGAMRYVYTECVGGGLFGTAYWFVPNLLIALGLLLIFRRWLRNPLVGAALLLASLFYGVNIYGSWIPALHSKAVLGFVFYLWLGAWGSWHFATLERVLSRVHIGVMAGLVLLTLILACNETTLLMSLHSTETTNTLRLTNQLYSVMVVLAIMKVKHAGWPRFLDVRKHTFGLYLTHPIALASLKQIIPYLGLSTLARSTAGTDFSLLCVFLMTYGGCLAAVRILLSSSWLRWTVGLATQAAGRVRSDATARQTISGDGAAALAERKPLPPRVSYTHS
jgi:hypothetical protein